MIQRANRYAFCISIGMWLAGCSAARHVVPVPLPPQPLQKITTAEVTLPASHEVPGLIGHLQQHRVASGETLLDIARDAGLGFQEIQEANPDVDEWVPKLDTPVVIPSRWIIPRARYRGVVINIAEMRLYLFPPRTRSGQMVGVRTWPVGIGTEHAPSPVGAFTITAKEENPTWIVPASIRRTMEEPKSVVPPGPDNPLGKYRVRLSKGLYEIHGTDVPWSIGRLTTHGCIRLYPEDIAELYPRVHRGTPGELIYQPVKFGQEDSRIYVEVHRDIYKRFANLEAHALAEARKVGVLNRVDRDQLRAAVRAHSGIPTDVTGDAPGHVPLRARR